MIGIINQSGHVAYGLHKYILDKVADVDDLNIDDTPGSEAYVVEDGSRYILNNSHEWVKKINSGGGGGCDCESLTEAEVLELLD